MWCLRLFMISVSYLPPDLWHLQDKLTRMTWLQVTPGNTFRSRQDRLHVVKVCISPYFSLDPSWRLYCVPSESSNLDSPLAHPPLNGSWGRLCPRNSSVYTISSSLPAVPHYHIQTCCYFHISLISSLLHSVLEASRGYRYVRSYLQIQKQKQKPSPGQLLPYVANSVCICSFQILRVCMCVHA